MLNNQSFKVNTLFFFLSLNQEENWNNLKRFTRTFSDLTLAVCWSFDWLVYLYFRLLSLFKNMQECVALSSKVIGSVEHQPSTIANHAFFSMLSFLNNFLTTFHIIHYLHWTTYSTLLITTNCSIHWFEGRVKIVRLTLTLRIPHTFSVLNLRYRAFQSVSLGLN